MGEQRTFADLAYERKGKVTRRERFLTEMDAVIPWRRLVARIEPVYPVAGNGRPPLGAEKMLRIYFLQHWFNLSDPGAEDALLDSEAMRRFARITLGEDVVPDESSILRFRHLLERHQLTEALFAEVTALLDEKRLLLRSGTIVDATFLEAPSSTKNATRTRDPEMTQTKKGTTWHFGMKVHVGTDPRGLVHTLTVTSAKVHELAELGALLHGGERALYGDKAYWSEALRQQCEASGVRYRVNRRGTEQHPVSDYWQAINRSRSRVRARGEHAFHVVKRLWGFRVVRYRGLAKNAARAFAAFALANLYLARRRLQAVGT